MNAPTTIRPATLKEVAFDLLEVRTGLDRHYARQRDPDEAEEADWDRLEARKSELETVFADTFHAVTGMRWSQAEQVMS